MDGNTRHEVEIIKAKKGGADVSHYLVPTQTGSDDTISSGIRDSGTVRSPPLIALPAVGTTITGVINWARRYQLMRTHTAMHILCGVVWRDYGAQVTGGNMAPLNGRMDFEFENLKRELVDEIEEKINTEVLAAREVHVAILPRTDAEQIPGLIRTKINLVPSSITEIRTVEIVGLDLQADGGTHVANTREVGRLRVIDYKSKGRINKRIRIALEDS
jgi:misacylated tRNA(Ala) deacylase